MNKFISHNSAALYWEIPNINVILGIKEGETQPLDFTYFLRSKRYYLKGQRVHLCQTPFPDKAIVSINDINVASPELVFVQLANELDIHRLILLGLQLCSHPPGKPKMAITTKQNLCTFTEKMKGHRGQRRAMRALKFIECGSASIMESLAYMILTLPNTLGGYCLNESVFNQEIKIKGKSSKLLGQNRCFVDLYYKSAKVAVEYDSYAFHNNPSEHGKDALRAAVLERQGVTLMSMKTIQLYDKEACKDFAYNLARKLGKRIRIRTKRFNMMNSELRKLLPTQD